MNRREEQPGLNVFAQIDAICREFRAKWKQGKRPLLENWLDRVPDQARSQLFYNLLEADLKYRRRLQESPRSDEYLQRFPEFSTQIRQAFDESTMGSLDLAGEAQSDIAAFGSDDSDETRTLGTSPISRLGEYELVRELGRGGFGVVYEALHRTRRNRVALKTLPTGHDGQEINADRLHKFRKEFRSLSEINHPNLVGMQSLEVEGDRWFFTMDLIEGNDFLTWVRPGDDLDESRLREALGQLARGIIFLHEKGIVHRDLKPSNVLVDKLGRVVILDFGLVAHLQTSTNLTISKSAMFAGTPRYAAPEQMFGERSEASDWYAFGTILHEAIAGNTPFSGRDLELLRQKQNEDPASLKGHADIPASLIDLAELVDGLLIREPQARLAASPIIDLLGIEVESTQYPTGTQSRGRSSSSEEADEWESLRSMEDETILIGRESQLKELESARQRVLTHRQPLVVWLKGLSGEGKSSLAEAFLRPLRQGQEMLVLSGRCYDRETVPYKAVDCLMESLVSFLRSQHAQPYTDKLPSDVVYLAQLFPLLHRVPAIAACCTPDLPRLEPERLRARGFHALGELLVMISRETPLAILIDDLQWGDADSTQPLLNILMADEAPAVLLLGSYRRDEADSSPFLENWHRLVDHRMQTVESREIELQPLTAQQCLELAARRTGADLDRLQRHAEVLLQDTGGNPYFLEQLIEGYDPATDRFQQVALDEMIEGRLRKLPEVATQMLEVISAAGQPIAITEACRAVGMEKPDLSTLTHMRSERLVRLVGDDAGGVVDTYHDKVRETVLERLDAGVKRSYALRLAEVIEEQEDRSAEDWLQDLGRSNEIGNYEAPIPVRVFDLARYFSEAGPSDKAFVYLLLASEQALTTFAFEDGESLYRQTVAEMPNSLTGPVQNNLTYRIELGRGRIALVRKKVDASLDHFKQAKESSRDSLGRALAESWISAAYLQIAHQNEAIDHATHALTELGVRLPRRSFFQLFSGIINFGRSLVSSPDRWCLNDTEKRAVAFQATRALWILAETAGDRTLASVLANFARFTIESLRTGTASTVQEGYSSAASIMAGLGFPRLAERFFLLADRSPSSGDDPESLVRQCIHRGTAFYWAGDLGQAQAEYELGLPNSRKCGDHYSSLVLLHYLRHTVAIRDSSHQELQYAQQLLQEATEVGNAKAVCWGFYDVASAHARVGHLERAAKHLQRAYDALPDQRFFATEAIRASTDAFVRLQASAYSAAAERSLHAWALVKESWIVADWALYCLPLRIESLAGPRWNEGPLDDQTRQLKRSLWPGRFLFRSIPNHQPHLLRVFGRAYAALGRPRKAIRYLEKAVALSGNKGMKYQQAKSLLDLAALQEENRDCKRTKAIELLKEMKSVIPRAESWLLGDHYDEQVVAPEFDLEAWEAEHGVISQPAREKPVDD